MKLTDARLISVITDHEAEPIWVKPEVDAYAVADEDVRAQLRAWGARADKITVCGIPTDPAFAEPQDKKATRARHGITTDAPVVLLMGGGMGLLAACDLAVAASDALFGTPEVEVGLFPYMALAAVSRCIGRRAALAVHAEGSLAGRRLFTRRRHAAGGPGRQQHRPAVRGGRVPPGRARNQDRDSEGAV